jgi:peptide/nickel transport system substrate-binding protein
MFNCSIVSEAFTSPDPTKLTEQMFGTGPFMQQEWQKGVSLTLVKNPNYWEPGLPYLDSVVVSVIPDDNARILQLQGGDQDAIGDVPSSQVQQLQTDSSLNVIQFPSTYSAYITLNTLNAPLNDVNARLALQYATDKQTLIQVVLNGVGTEATTFMPKGAEYWNPNLPGFPFDLDKAKSLIAQSATPSGFSIDLEYVAGDTEVDALGAALKDMWSKIGVDLTLNPVEQSVWTDDYRGQKFQAMQNSWTNDIIDPDELVAYAVLPESSHAFGTGWANPDAVALAKQGAAELDPDKRQEIYYKIQELFNQDSPMILLYHKPYIDVTTTKVHDLGHPPTGQWVFKQTWIES